MSNRLATLISIIFHPIWFPFGMLLLYLQANPIVFGLSRPMEDMILVFQSAITSLLLPLISMVVMWKVKLISSLDMDNRLERIGPYIAMLIFLLWYYLNINQYGVAPIFRLYILGTIVSLALVFITNLFVKVSAHATGIAGVCINLVIAWQKFDYTVLPFRFRSVPYVLDFEIIIIIFTLILFIVLLSRFHLKKHTPMELLGGIVIGFFGQVLAIRLMEII